jgi:hypothetical protein
LVAAAAEQGSAAAAAAFACVLRAAVSTGMGANHVPAVCAAAVQSL